MSVFTTRPELIGTFGMVTSTHWLASAAGMAMLERGGNAFDAAVAAGFVLQVVEPHMNGPGGDSTTLLHDAAKGETLVLCGQGVAPGAATIETFRDLGLGLVPGTGLLAAVVPGAFDAWLLMLRDRGTLPLREVLAPAIGYAECGYPVAEHVSGAIQAVAGLFRQYWPSSAAVYLAGGTGPRPGQLFRNPALAAFYRRLLLEAEAVGRDREGVVEAARNVFYTGFVADAIDRFCRGTEVMDSSGRPHHGLLTGDDMVDWRSGYEAPATLDYEDFVVCKGGGWGQGPIFLQQLALLKHFDVAGMDPEGPEFVHTVVECAKLALADREAYYGDRPGMPAPIPDLLAPGYNAARARLVEERASHDFRPGDLPGHAAYWPSDDELPLNVAELEATFGTGEPVSVSVAAGPPRGDTCHLDVVDARGNMVSATPSGGWLQSSPVIPELGFPLGTRGQMFRLDPGSPAAVGPGRRPRTTLSATLALRDGKPAMAMGTPGGDQQDQWTLTLFLRVVHHYANLQQAIDAPTFHTNHTPSSFWPRRAHPGEIEVETRLPQRTLDELAARGHHLKRVGDWALGRLSAVARDETPEGIALRAAANPRRMQGYAAGR